MLQSIDFYSVVRSADEMQYLTLSNQISVNNISANNKFIIAGGWVKGRASSL